jgi:hypothetical protein
MLFPHSLGKKLGGFGLILPNPILDLNPKKTVFESGSINEFTGTTGICCFTDNENNT